MIDETLKKLYSHHLSLVAYLLNGKAPKQWLVDVKTENVSGGGEPELSNNNNTEEVHA